jgi:hypothetical protein
VKNEKQIRAVVNEAAKILKDYPHLKYYQAIIKAKEVLNDEYNIRECSRPDDSTRCN